MQEKAKIYLVFQKHQLIVNTDSSPLTENNIASFKDVLQYQHKIEDNVQQTIYCAELPEAHAIDPPLQTLPLRKALELLAPQWYNLVAKAYAILNWDKYHFYCGRCQSMTTKIENVFERICPTCNNIFYPRISPSVIVLIHDNDHILMARSPHFIKGAYGLIAGFIEPGESAEDAIHREVHEEVNIKIKNLRYFGSQAWPFPDSLMFGFFAEYDSGELLIDHKEIENAGWYHYTALPGRPSSKISIASKLLDHFLKQRVKDEEKK